MTNYFYQLWVPLRNRHYQTDLALLSNCDIATFDLFVMLIWVDDEKSYASSSTDMFL